MPEEDGLSELFAGHSAPTEASDKTVFNFGVGQ